MPKFNHYSPKFNPGWAKLPNFAWTGQNALIPDVQGGGFQGNTSSSSYQRPPFQGVYNSLGGLPLQWVVVQSFLPPRYNEIEK